MHVGVSELFTGADGRDAPWMLEAAVLLEDLGFHSLWLPERMTFFPVYETTHPYEAQPEVVSLSSSGIFDSLTALSAVAATTSRIRLGTYVALPTLRQPVAMARAVATLDHVARGRFDFGVGVGWLEEEYEALGIPWENRGARLTEYLQAMRAMWTSTPTEFRGDFVNLPGVKVGPQPYSDPHPRIAIGGNSDAALRRAAHVGDRWLGYNLTIPQLQERMATLQRLVEESGRPVNSVTTSVGMRVEGTFGAHEDFDVDRGVFEQNAEYIKACDELGLEEVVVSTRMPRVGYEDHMAAFAEAVGLNND